MKSSRAPQWPPPVGSVIGDVYRLRTLLGQGGAAIVYEAARLVDGTPVAVKVLKPDTRDPVPLQRRLFKELVLTTRVRHANIVKIHDFGMTSSGGWPYIVMDRLHGCTMREVLDDTGPLPAAQAIPLFLGMLGAVASAHEQGVAHKDLKPSNLFLCEGRPLHESLVVLDFGIAARVRADAEKDGLLEGTPQYLAPEYIRSKQVSPLLDVYQLGLVLAEILTGAQVVPFDDPQQCIRIHRQGRVMLPPQLPPGPIRRVLDRAIAFDPELRYPDARALLDALSAPAVMRSWSSMTEAAVDYESVSASPGESWTSTFPVEWSRERPRTRRGLEVVPDRLSRVA